MSVYRVVFDGSNETLKKVISTDLANVAGFGALHFFKDSITMMCSPDYGKALNRYLKSKAGVIAYGKDNYIAKHHLSRPPVKKSFTLIYPKRVSNPEEILKTRIRESFYSPLGFSTLDFKLTNDTDHSVLTLEFNDATVAFYTQMFLREFGWDAKSYFNPRWVNE